jgi:poly(hydroxyalkanoate) depolymerase family esterase
MRVSKTISRLNKVRKSLEAFTPAEPAVERLSDLTGLTDNPGNLRGRFYVPEGLEGGAALVVVLHGCTQNAAVYDHGSGWSRLADRHGFALLFPEQQRSNNANLCFNWFDRGDTARGQGEAASIRDMIAVMGAAHAIDESRIFITGLSAGGAMASVMLASYPELFAGGAIIAGLPYGCAASVAQAFGCMGGRDKTSRAELGARVRAASAHQGPWPRISIWQGGADQTVVPSNAEAIVQQWAEVHGLPAEPSATDTVDGYPRRVWRGADGAELIEEYVIGGMAHGAPLAPGSDPGQSGKAGAHMLDVGLSSTDRIAAFWGIAPPAAAAKPRKAAAKAKQAAAQEPAAKRAAPRRPARRPKLLPTPVSDVQKIIEDALRAAGLMR